MQLRASFLLQKLLQLALHGLFWLGVLFFYTYFFGYGTKDIDYVFNFSIFLMPITIGLTYIMIYRLIPRFLMTKQYFKFVLYSIYSLIISAYLIIISVFFGLIYLSDFNVDGMAPISRNVGFVMIGVYLVVLMVSAYKLLKLNTQTAVANSKLKTKIAETQLKFKEQELNYLKMQIHPHFLFNTLNTIYGYALKKAEEAPEMILKLSNLLDYLLYQTDKPFVLLSEEINHINDYIALEKLRFNEDISVSFNVEKINKNYKIAPMLLLPFVENSFKHGTAVNGVKTIEIQLENVDDKLLFKVKNNSNNTMIISGGIGLDNIKKRLKLIYKNNYELQIKNSHNEFVVELNLFTPIDDAR